MVWSRMVDSCCTGPLCCNHNDDHISDEDEGDNEDHDNNDDADDNDDGTATMMTAMMMTASIKWQIHSEQQIWLRTVLRQKRTHFYILQQKVD